MRQTYRTDTKFIKDMPQLSKKRRYHCLRFMAGYRVGLTGAVLEYAVKKYKSHRRLSACINLATLDLEYKTKKEEQMTFKRSK